MKNAIMVRGVVLVAAVVGAAVAYAQGAEDDAVLKAPDAEISEIDKKGGGEAVKEAAESEAESIKPAPGRRRSAQTSRKPPADSTDERQDRPRKRASKDSKVIVVTVTGKGETKEEAKLAAFRAAVEKAVGVWVDAESLMENDELLKDRVNTISNADIKKYETIKEGRMKSGLYACQIKAWVEKKAIAPKFANVFPAAFASVEEAAQTIHVQKVTKAKRSGDAAALMTAALEGVDRMRNWVRLSVVKGKALEEVKKIGRQEVNEVPGKGLYSVRYSMKIDEDAYFKGFLPHFKEVLTKMHEGKAEEDVVLTSGPFNLVNARPDQRSVEVDGRVIQVTENGVYDLPPDLKPFCPYGKIGNTYFVDPITLSGFPGVAPSEPLGAGNSLGQGFFMFDRYDSNGCKIQETRSYNIWLLDKMNKDRTSVRCSAYKVPVSALRSYWKSLFGDVDSSERCSPKIHEKVEIVLLDGNGEEISARIDDHVPAMLIASGPVSDRCIDKYISSGHRKGGCYWRGLNVFNSFFIRPMFVNYSQHGRITPCYSSEIQRDVYFPLTDAQLEKVKQVKVRFVGGRSKRKQVDNGF